MNNFNKTIYMFSFYGLFLVLAIIFGGSKDKYFNAKETSFKTQKENKDTIEIVLDRILEIENSCNYSIGDSGKSIGKFQITKDCVCDVNRRFNTKYTHNMMFDSAKAREVAKKYILIGNDNYRKKEGKEPTIYIMLRNYNGGAYNGYKNIKTINYK